MTAGTLMTFAYGSNMLTTRLRDPKRCPSAKPLGVAELEGYELQWHKRSSDGSGKCDIVASASAEARVFGVLYQIAISEKPALDEAEGLGKGYKEIEVEVVCNGQRMTAKAYQATNTDSRLKPYNWYRTFVITGAKEHGLPSKYIEWLEQVAAKEDPNFTRHDLNMRLIPEALR
jgi:gamma-glutamylcyclotransferase